MIILVYLHQHLHHLHLHLRHTYHRHQLHHDHHHQYVLLRHNHHLLLLLLQFRTCHRFRPALRRRLSPNLQEFQHPRQPIYLHTHIPNLRPHRVHHRPPPKHRVLQQPLAHPRVRRRVHHLPSPEHRARLTRRQRRHSRRAIHRQLRLRRTTIQRPDQLPCGFPHLGPLPFRLRATQVLGHRRRPDLNRPVRGVLPARATIIRRPLQLRHRRHHHRHRHRRHRDRDRVRRPDRPLRHLDLVRHRHHHRRTEDICHHRVNRPPKTGGTFPRLDRTSCNYVS